MWISEDSIKYEINCTNSKVIFEREEPSSDHSRKKDKNS